MNSFGATPSGVGWRVSSHQTIPPAITMTAKITTIATPKGTSRLIISPSFPNRWLYKKPSELTRIHTEAGVVEIPQVSATACHCPSPTPLIPLDMSIHEADCVAFHVSAKLSGVWWWVSGVLGRTTTSVSSARLRVNNSAKQEPFGRLNLPVSTEVNTSGICKDDSVSRITKLGKSVETEGHELIVAITDVDAHPTGVIVPDDCWEVAAATAPTRPHCRWAFKELAVSKVRFS